MRYGNTVFTVQNSCSLQLLYFQLRVDEGNTKKLAMIHMTRRNLA